MNISLRIIKSIRLTFLLKLSIFLIIFALSSSIVSVWFDMSRRDININLTNSQNEQKLFRNVYGRLWDEYFELKSAEYSIFDYAQSIEMQKYYEEADTLICMFDHLKAFHSNQTIIATIQRGRSYLTETQLHEFRISEIEKTANQRTKEIEDAYLKYCSSIDDYNIGEGLQTTLSHVELIIILSRELKTTLEERVMIEKAQLAENYKKSNIAIFVAFLLQLVVFTFISIVDIRTVRLGRSSQ